MHTNTHDDSKLIRDASILDDPKPLRSRTYQLRLTEDEHILLPQQAEDAGFESVADYLRHLLGWDMARPNLHHR